MATPDIDWYYVHSSCCLVPLKMTCAKLQQAWFPQDTSVIPGYGFYVTARLRKLRHLFHLHKYFALCSRKGDEYARKRVIGKLIYTDRRISIVKLIPEFLFSVNICIRLYFTDHIEKLWFCWVKDEFYRN